MNDYKLSKNSTIYQSYIKPLGFYQIILFEKELIKPFLFKSEVENELFIFDDFFAVYKHKKLYYYQEIKKDFDLEELKEFIKKGLFIDEIKITYKEDVSFCHEHENNHTFIKPIKSRLFRYFLLYIFLICSFLFFYDSYNFSNTDEINSINNLKTQTQKIRLSKKFTYLSSHILDIYEKSKEKKVFLNSLDIKNAKIIINLNSRNKKSIYAFLNEFKDMRIESIYYDEKVKRFISNASFKIHRK